MRLHKCRGYFHALMAKANSIYSNRISISLFDAPNLSINMNPRDKANSNLEAVGINNYRTNLKESN